MTFSQHHPSEEVLLRYVSGGYDTAYNLVLATHIGMCSQCQKTVALQQEVGGQTLRAQKPAKMQMSADDVLERKMDMKDETPVSSAGHSKTLGLSIPPLLNTYLSVSFDKLKWQRLSSSVKQHILKVDGGTSLRMIWINPGKAVPAHGHRGEEMTLVMSGGYFDANIPYTKGDLHYADHEAPHMPVAMPDVPCLVLAAADSPLIFRNLVPRLLQPFYKI